MGSGMAAMALAGSVPAAAVPPLAFAVLFAALAVQGVWQLGARLRPGDGGGGGESRHHLHHILGSLAMVYMAAATQPAHSGGAHATGAAGPAAVPAGIPLLTGVLLAYFASYVLLTGLRLLPAPAEGAAAGPAPGLSRPVPRPQRREPAPPPLTSACRLAMGTAMLTMLAAM